jgi:hypothetical protein
MTRAELLALAERVEKAQGADRHLDVDIYHAFGEPLGTGVALPPAFTASLDAAASLVPEGWGYWIDGSAPELGITVSVMPIDPADRRDKRGDAATPALALTAAALRARAEEAGE